MTGELLAAVLIFAIGNITGAVGGYFFVQRKIKQELSQGIDLGGMEEMMDEMTEEIGDME